MDRRLLLVLAILAAATLTVFWPVVRHGYFAMDDDLYVAGNDRVQAGLTFDGLRWSFTSVGYAANWHPLTWLSLMLDTTFLGRGAGGHHLVNLLLHVINAILLCLVVWRYAGVPWVGLLTAALFALHPLHVESVAWIAERKDVLSACFGWLALLAWLGYVRRPRPGRYLAALVLFALGLLAKPMLVTLPFLLLLLDWWPLGRFRAAPRSLSRLLGEKVPFLLLAVGSSLMTWMAQSRGGLVAPLEGVPPLYRMANALTAYVRYLGHMAWPARLAFFYPHPGRSLPWWQAGASLLLLAALTALALGWGRRRPWLPVGWFWYLGTLVPVIGLAQVGTQAMADRYTYLPLTGPFFILAGVTVEAAARRPRLRWTIAAATLLVLAALGVLTRIQVGYWRDSITLYERTLEVTRDNWVIENNLGMLLSDRGRYQEAIDHFSRALRRKPNFPDIHHNLAVALSQTGRIDEALAHYEQALRGNPRSVETRYNLANLLVGVGRLDEAAREYREVLSMQPGSDFAHNNLATILGRQGRIGEALEHYREAVRLNPRNAEALNNLGATLMDLGQGGEALVRYREALRVRPGYLMATLNLARAFDRLGRVQEALSWYREVLRLAPDDAEARARLAELARAG